MTEIVTEKLKMLPTDPGVYIMKNAEGTVIYVGKAKNLKNRVKQYFYTGVKTDKVMAMVSHVSDFDYIITPTEIDALTLENNLIKKHKPRYNILLKDLSLSRRQFKRAVSDFPHHAQNQAGRQQVFRPLYGRRFRAGSAGNFIARLFPAPLRDADRAGKAPPPLPELSHQALHGALCGAVHRAGISGKGRRGD